MENSGRKVMLLVGLPGSGKTTFAKEYEKAHPMSRVVSLDDCRSKYPMRNQEDLLRAALCDVPACQ